MVRGILIYSPVAGYGRNLVAPSTSEVGIKVVPELVHALNEITTPSYSERLLGGGDCLPV